MYAISRAVSTRGSISRAGISRGSIRAVSARQYLHDQQGITWMISKGFCSSDAAMVESLGQETET